MTARVSLWLRRPVTLIAMRSQLILRTMFRSVSVVRMAVQSCGQATVTVLEKFTATTTNQPHKGPMHLIYNKRQQTPP